MARNSSQRTFPFADATFIAKLRDAGAVLLAKTAMCDFAAGWFSSSSITDHTKNPYSLEHEAGGSSAGTAAGVAANFGMVGIGEDTGGSVRVPASFNNLFGLRVTTGLISRTGFSPLVHFQDTPGAIGRTVSDVASLLDAVVGFDPDDPMTVAATLDPPEVGYSDALTVSPSIDHWRIGVLETAFGSDTNPDAAPVNRTIRSAIADLGHLGVSTVEALKMHPNSHDCSSIRRRTFSIRSRTSRVSLPTDPMRRYQALWRSTTTADSIR